MGARPAPTFMLELAAVTSHSLLESEAQAFLRSNLAPPCERLVIVVVPTPAETTPDLATSAMVLGCLLLLGEGDSPGNAEETIRQVSVSARQ